MAKSLGVEEFLEHPGVLFDVRSPGEYTHGRIPGALSLPLFTDDERARVGTTYKQCGKDAAVLLGLQLTGPKLASFVEMARAASKDADIRVHCWRGGMRSGSMAWLLETAGMVPVTLQGGYKSFRHWCSNLCAKSRRYIVLGGMTGVGKTEKLRELQARGEQVLDLEALACHRGSAFGAQGPQPSTEQFENEIAMQLAKFSHDRPVWLEDESRLIGTCYIPQAIFTAMKEAEYVLLEAPRDERLARLCREYGQQSHEQLIASTSKLAKQLGGLRTAQAIEAITHGHIQDAASMLLEYYDSTYAYSMKKYPKRRESKLMP